VKVSSHPAQAVTPKKDKEEGFPKEKNHKTKELLLTQVPNLAQARFH